jgi:hypothetical protein
MFLSLSQFVQSSKHTKMPRLIRGMELARPGYVFFRKFVTVIPISLPHEAYLY